MAEPCDSRERSKSQAGNELKRSQLRFRRNDLHTCDVYTILFPLLCFRVLSQLMFFLSKLSPRLIINDPAGARDILDVRLEHSTRADHQSQQPPPHSLHQLWHGIRRIFMPVREVVLRPVGSVVRSDGLRFKDFQSHLDIFVSSLHSKPLPHI